MGHKQQEEGEGRKACSTFTHVVRRTFVCISFEHLSCSSIVWHGTFFLKNPTPGAAQATYLGSMSNTHGKYRE